MKNVETPRPGIRRVFSCLPAVIFLDGEKTSTDSTRERGRGKRDSNQPANKPTDAINAPKKTERSVLGNTGTVRLGGFVPEKGDL